MSPARRLRRLGALLRKETLQIVRDPSTLLLAMVFPMILRFIVGAGINRESSVVPRGVVAQDGSPQARRFVDTLAGSPSFRVITTSSIDAASDRLRAGEVRGFVVIRDGFGQQVVDGHATTPGVLVVTDGAEPNTASFVDAYVRGTYGVWLREEGASRGAAPPEALSIESRAWFNPSTTSRNFLLPGSVTIIMTVVGALLTALVVAREWERGTMEALLAAGISRFELVCSKLVTYFVLGMIAFGICTGLTVWVFDVPFRGSLGALLLVAGTFLGSALGTGLLLSTALRSQYNAAQAALNAAFLPAMMLSGFVFEISSMPAVLRHVTRIVPARYFVTAMQTLFQAGDVWPVLRSALLGLSLAAFAFLGATFLLTKRRLQ